jgi:hypothetical protein
MLRCHFASVFTYATIESIKAQVSSMSTCMLALSAAALLIFDATLLVYSCQLDWGQTSGAALLPFAILKLLVVSCHPLSCSWHPS